MTTFAYRGGELATDSRVLRHQDQHELERSTFMEKAYISKCGRMILAKAGPTLTPEFMEKLVESLVPQILKWRKDPNYRIEVAEVTNNFWETLLVITKDSAHHLSQFRTHLLEGDDYATLGSGQFYAKGALEAGQGVVEAVKATLRFDRLSGGKVWHYKASELKPLVEE